MCHKRKKEPSLDVIDKGCMFETGETVLVHWHNYALNSTDLMHRKTKSLLKMVLRTQ